MLSRPRRELEVLSVSALDLFASALGVFILLAILLFPYYLKQPSLDADIAAQAAEMIAAGNDLNAAEQAAKDADRRRAEARAARDSLISEIQSLQSVLADSELAAEAAAQRVSEVGQEIASEKDRLAALPVIDLDLVIVMDTTGSMRQEIADIRANLLGLVGILRRLSPSLHIGFVAYRDVGEDYVTKQFPLSPMTEGNLDRLQDFVNRLGAQGGGDDPENVREGLSQALAMPWRRDVQARILVIGDAQAHLRDVDGVMRAAQRFRDGGSARAEHQLSAIFTGSSRVGRDFFKALAASGGGEFIDHEGRIVEAVLLSVLATRGGGQSVWGVDR